MSEGIDAQKLIEKLGARIGELEVNNVMLDLTIETLRASTPAVDDPEPT